MVEARTSIQNIRKSFNINPRQVSFCERFSQNRRCRLLVRRRQWHPTLVLVPGKSQGWGSLVGCSPCGRGESDATEWLPFHFSLSCIGEGNGNLLQCSCLENPRDGGAWWAAVYGVAQSRTRLKWLSSSSGSSSRHIECSTLTASLSRILKSSAGISSPPLVLFIVMFPKAPLTSHTGKSLNIELNHHFLIPYFLSII